MRRTESADYPPPFPDLVPVNLYFILVVPCRTMYARKFVEARPELVRCGSDGGHFVTITSNFTAD